MKICYCFDHSEQEIIDDVLANNGKSRILEDIRTSKKGGLCQCARNHPEKR